MSTSTTVDQKAVALAPDSPRRGRPVGTKKNTVRYTLRLTAEAQALLDAQAQAKGTTAKALAEQVLSDWARRQFKKAG